MNRNRIVWIFLWIVGFFFFLFYPYAISLYTLLFLVFLPLLSLVLTLLGRRKLAMQLSFSSPGKRPKDLSLSLILRRPSRLPLPKIQLLLTLKNEFTEETVYRQLEFPLIYREHTLSIPAFSPHCGKITLQIEKAKIIDFSGIFAFSVPCPKKAAFFLHPASFAPVLPGDRLFTQESTETLFSAQKGEDSTEILGFHSMQEGDRFRDIHWKLSVRTQDLMIREGSRPQRQPVGIFLLLTGTAAELECLLAAFCSLCRAVFSSGSAAKVVCWDRERLAFRSLLLEGESQLSHWLQQTLSSPAPTYEEMRPSLAAMKNIPPCVLFLSGTFSPHLPETSPDPHHEDVFFPVLPGMIPGSSMLLLAAENEPAGSFFSRLQQARISFQRLDPSGLQDVLPPSRAGQDHDAQDSEKGGSHESELHQNPFPGGTQALQ